MLAVRLSSEIERRLDELAEPTERSTTVFAREAIKTHREDLEDFHLAEERLRHFRVGDAVPSSALKAEIGQSD